MNVGFENTMDHTMHAMHEASDSMQHDMDEESCERCEEHASEDLALSNFASHHTCSPSAAVSVAFTATAYSEEIHLQRITTHLATAGPPLAPLIVESIVLRT